MLSSIQALRALAAWLVVFHHYAQVVYSFKLADPLSVFLFKYGAVGVDLFFVISGFVIYLSVTGRNTSPAVFAVHRVARIVPAYWLFTLITSVVLIYYPGVIPLTQFDNAFAIKSMFFVPAQNPSGIGFYPLVTVGWTLNYEMAFYGIFLASLFFADKYRVPVVILGVVLLSSALPKLGGSFSFYGNPILYEFILGILIAYAYQNGFVHRIGLLAALAMVAIAVVLIISFGQVTHSPWKSGGPCALIVLAVLSQERFFKQASFVNKLGDWSYSTYLCHVVVICIIVKLRESLDLNGGVALIITVAVTMVVSAVCYNLVERPISKFAKLRFTKSSTCLARPTF